MMVHLVKEHNLVFLQLFKKKITPGKNEMAYYETQVASGNWSFSCWNLFILSFITSNLYVKLHANPKLENFIF